MKYAQGIIKNLSDVAPNLQGFAKAVDQYAKKSIDELKKTDPKKAEQIAREYAQTMSEAKMDEKFADLLKSFGK